MSRELTIQATTVFEKNWDAKTRFVVNIGGSRSTKTYSILQFLIVKAIESTEPLTISVVRKSFPSMRITVLRDFFEILKSYDLYNVENHNKSENTYQLNNTLIEFFSIDDAMKRRGSKRNILFINEANELTYEDFFQLNIRTEDQIFLDFNPSEIFWYNDHLQHRDDVTTIHSTYKDNPFLSYEQIKEIERLEQTDLQYWKIYGLGQFGGSFNTVFTYVPVDTIPTNTAKPVALGMDFGYSQDPTSLVEVWIDNENNIYLNELIYDKDLTNQDIANKLSEYGIDRYTEIIADSAEPKSIEEIRRMGFNIKPAVKGPDSILNGIDILKRHKIHVTKESTNLLKEFSMYKWVTDKNGNTLNKPVDMYNHAIDAVRYVALNKLRKNNEGKYNISIVGNSKMNSARTFFGKPSGGIYAIR
jgi:phage terminase large subunit